MYELMAALEDSAPAHWLRGLGVWTYGVLNLAHILGVSSLFGAILILDLKLLGAWRTAPVAVIARAAIPVAASGFVLAAAAGSAMILFNTTEYHGNPFLYIKLSVIAAGLVNVAVVSRLRVWRRAVSGKPAAPGDGARLAVIGAISLLLWLTAVTCGRMIGYW